MSHTQSAARRARNSASFNVTYAPQTLPLTATVRYKRGLPINPHIRAFARVENLADAKYRDVFGYVRRDARPMAACA